LEELITVVCAERSARRHAQRKAKRHAHGPQCVERIGTHEKRIGEQIRLQKGMRTARGCGIHEDSFALQHRE
jgi:hypothetical protein